ncbi:restriction system protein [Pseudomonas sp. LAMO17WK12:I10]|uniref:restriction endonuclease n=1 Tax=unclassified Pseudomonas TaxID=196821 RepID=UPI000BDC058D|nr:MULTISPECIES: restriction endonuclease [unclassified Pseudomonas]PXX73152.1 restriction system protein [Pseudomonas sp. LAMO17WK12:I9]SNY28792.1 restriction system protein [Pseudomonas sp. LAMO17WK12:I10]
MIPPIFLIGGILGWTQRKIRARKFRSISNSDQPGFAIRNLNWDQFEQMVGEAFRKQGYAVAETVKGPDGGIDLELRRGGELFLVQCKQWKAEKVSVQVVRELYGVMSARGAAGGFVVTSGVFTKDAWKFAMGTSVHLVDGSRLVEWFKAPNTKIQYPSVTSSVPTDDSVRGVEAPAGNHELNGNALSPIDTHGQECPRCGGAMTARYARAINQGIAQSVFLGCLNFPACRGTRPLEG